LERIKNDENNPLNAKNDCMELLKNCPDHIRDFDYWLLAERRIMTDNHCFAALPDRVQPE
jgi:hypothetical protein